MSLMGLKEKSLKGSFWTTVENLGTALLGFGLYVVLARLLNPETFGLLELAYSSIAILEFLDLIRFNALVIQRDSLEEEKLDTIFWINILENLVLFFLALAIAQPVAWFYEDPKLAQVIVVLALIFPLSSLGNVFRSLLKRELALRFFSLTKVISLGTSGSIAIFLAYSGYGIWSLIIHRLGERMIEVSIYWIFCSWRPGLNFSLDTLSGDFSFIRDVSLTGIMSTLRKRGLYLILGYFLGNASLGYLSIAQKIQHSVSSIVTSGMQRTALPAFSRLQDDLQKLSSVFVRTLKVAQYMMFPFFLGLILLVPYALPYFFGQEWIPSVIMVQILAVGGCTKPLETLSKKIFVALDRTDLTFNLGLLVCVTHLSAVTILAPFGINAVLLAIVGTNFCVIAPYVLYYLPELLEIDYGNVARDLGTVLIPVISMIATHGLISKSLSTGGVQNRLVYLTLLSSALPLSYLVTIYLFKNEDYEKIKSLLLRSLPVSN